MISQIWSHNLQPRAVLLCVPVLRKSRCLSGFAMEKPSNKVYFQVLSTGYNDTTPSLLLFTDSQRYLFNCSEGTQRLFTECKVKLARLEKLFFTRLDWNCLGGLPGMAMTLRDTGKTKLSLFGPEGFQNFLHATRSFLKHEKLQFDVREWKADDACGFTDNELQITPIVIRGQRNALHDCEAVTSSSPNSSSPLHLLECPQEPPSTICYSGRLVPLPGRFLPKMAISLGVPKGPKFGDLQRGLTVTLDDGTIVKPDMVMDKAKPGPEFCIIDCQSTASIESLACNSQLNDVLSNPRLNLAIHLADSDVIEDRKYQEWIARSPNGVHHWFVSKERLSTGPVTFQSRFAIQCKLHGMDPTCFPLIDNSRHDELPSTEPTDSITFANNCDRFHLRPASLLGLERNLSTTPLDVAALIAEGALLVRGSAQTPSVDRRILRPRQKRTHSSLEDDEVHQSASSARELSNGPCESTAYPRVVFLGTGAAIPSKYRNVSSILLRVSPSDSILLDCGEGTYGQLVSHYGSSASDILQSIHCIFISHMHADHHLGLIRILLRQQRNTVKKKSLQVPVVVAPGSMLQWLTEYAEVAEGLDLRFIDCDRPQLEEVSIRLNDSQVQLRTARVEHFGKSYGCSIEDIGRWKITYSGDAMPSEPLCDIGRNSTLLIHEATLEDGMEEEAKLKRHSTMGQALGVATQMNAKHTILTHFSQRYPKIPVGSNVLRDNVAIAFDHLEIGVDDIKRLNRLLPNFELLFSEEDQMLTKDE